MLHFQRAVAASITLALAATLTPDYRPAPAWAAEASAKPGSPAASPAQEKGPLDKVGSTIEGFRVQRVTDVPELGARARVFEHVKSGAQLLYLSSSDDNKVFAITFRTPPTDDTGVPHILEHAVLCGSKHFPTKEPFADLLKGSLQTFLNAFTANDRTMYPVASRNDKDFLNLVHVYLDAVFYPRLETVPEIMMQEGWHYEVDPKTGELSYNGIVYNEMKGALSSPQRLLSQTIEQSLFPNGTYGHSSGGDPQAIPSLTQEKFVAFHKQFYHPSNSLIYLYGNGDVRKHLAFLDREYLKDFDRRKIDADVVLQKPLAAPREVVGEYSVGQQDPTQDKTFLSLTYVLGSSPDPDVYFGMDLLSYILLDSQAAPLRRVLLSAGIGKDLESQLEQSILQPYLSLIVKNSNPEMKEKFLVVVDKTLRELVENGIDKKLIEAAINRKEFALREAEVHHFPKGLAFFMRAIDSWNYGADPLLYLRYEPVLKRIKEAANHGYFEQLIRKHLLNNKFRAVVILKPKPGLDRENAEKQQVALAKLRASMSPAELERIKQAQESLRARQAAPDKPEDQAKIPTLSLSDLKREAEVLPLKVYEIGGGAFLNHSLPTAKIVYLRLYFDARTVPPELTPYVSLLASVLGKVGTAKRDYQDFTSEVDIHTGGIDCDLAPISHKSDPDVFYPMFVVTSKAMLPKVPNQLGLLSEMLLTSKLDDKQRLKEIVQEAKIGAEQSVIEHGHLAAYLRAASCISPGYAYRDAANGLSYYQFLAGLDQDFDKRADDLIAKLRTVARLLFQRGASFQLASARGASPSKQAEGSARAERQVENLPHVLASVTLPEAEFLPLRGDFEKLISQLPAGTPKLAPRPFTPSTKNEAVIIPSKVQYVAEAADYRAAGGQYSGKMRVLSHVLGRTYLWDRVRVMNGAYGSDMGVDRSGVLFLWSFRDPHLLKTTEAFSESVKFLDGLEMSDREHTRAIIATIGEMDQPLTAAQKGSAATWDYLTRVTLADRQRERDEVLATSVADLKGYSGLLRKALANGRLCVLGSEEKIQEDRKLFQTVTKLAK
jgi:Zn-dependent M16 (insulinase) family peptidase